LLKGETGSMLSGYNTGGQENTEEIVVYAPAGLLGLVLENPSDDGPPTVHSISPTSPLINQVQLNDQLVTFDEIDVRPMNTNDISELIGARSALPVRTLTFVRKTRNTNRENASIIASMTSMSQLETDSDNDDGDSGGSAAGVDVGKYR
jgi:hypothetical protein